MSASMHYVIPIPLFPKILIYHPEFGNELSTEQF